MAEKIILLVEDNPDDEFLALRALKRHDVGATIVVVHDGQAAIEYLFDEEAPLPELILLDLKLPKVDGLELLRRSRANERTAILPIVMLSSSTEEPDLLESYRAGCNSYIRKPVDFNRFADSMGELLRYWLVNNESPPKNVVSK